VSDDSSLRTVLRTALGDAGYTVYEGADLTAPPCSIDGGAASAVLLADARVGAPLWSFCRAHMAGAETQTVVILAANAAEEAQARDAGVTNILRQPLPIDDLITCVARVTDARATSVAT
jgi:DNA-binding response OmpR family regulator